jgi:hypothetical protein
MVMFVKTRDEDRPLFRYSTFFCTSAGEETNMSIVLMSTGVPRCASARIEQNPSEFVFYAARILQETGLTGRHV